VLKRRAVIDRFSCSWFTTPQGAQEYYIACCSGGASSFENALDILNRNYLSALEDLGLHPDTLAFCRFHLSDIVNQKKILARSEVFKNVGFGAVSIVEQVPCSNDFALLFAYHVRGEQRQFHKEIFDYTADQTPAGASIAGNHYTMVWAANTSAPLAPDSHTQTTGLLSSFLASIERMGMTVRRNLIRSWMYVRDIDNHYQGMVDGRREFFSAHGLTPASRFIASTGIEGKGPDMHSLVTMDSLLLGNIAEEQIEVMNALENLSRPFSYGVTFERGLRVRFGDRSHLYISGTASIDNKGNILHDGDIEKQTHRTIDNIEALLGGQGATLEAMAYAVAYLRNPKHFPCVHQLLLRRLPPGLPLIIVEGAVCRQGWLFEMEGVAVTADATRFPPFF
jgi:enamine deaminase RidA (YjgF/YER057c/UK114 family)